MRKRMKLWQHLRDSERDVKQTTSAMSGAEDGRHSSAVSLITLLIPIADSGQVKVSSESCLGDSIYEGRCSH
jgi:hypothetical protein